MRTNMAATHPSRLEFSLYQKRRQRMGMSRMRSLRRVTLMACGRHGRGDRRRGRANRCRPRVVASGEATANRAPAKIGEDDFRVG
jgi:hypothetical protein